MEKLWVMRPCNPDWRNALIAAGYSPLAASLLAARGCDSAAAAEHYLHPQLSDMHNPLLLKDMDRAVRLLAQAIQKRWRVRLFTDYDADGVTAGSMFWRFLRRIYRRQNLPLDLVDCVTPDRFTEGYGLNPQRVRQAAADGVNLIITFDCGIRSRVEADLAHELGMRIIITDHHNPPLDEPLPAADAVVDPHRPDCPYPFKGLCGVGIAFKFQWAFLLAAKSNILPILTDLDFTAVGTVADMMELVDENRAIVRYGLHVLNGDGLRAGDRWVLPQGWSRLQFAALTGAREEEGRRIDAETIGFQIGPRINAPGRVGSAQDCIDYFLLDDDDAIRAAAARLHADNDLRQRLTDEGAALVRQSFDPANPPPAIVFSSPFAEFGDDAPLLKGVVGIIAGRIGQEFHRPTIVLQETGDGLAVGSARAILDDLHLFNTLSAVEHLFTRFGGHKPAAGLTIPVVNIPELRAHLCRVVEAMTPAQRQPQVFWDAELTADVLERETAFSGFPLIQMLSQMEPFGQGNPKPLFLLRGAEVIEARGVGKTEPKQHLKLRLRPTGSQLMLDAVAWREYQPYLAQGQPEKIDIAFYPVINSFRGEERLQLMVQEWRPTAASGRARQSA